VSHVAVRDILPPNAVIYLSGLEEGGCLILNNASGQLLEPFIEVDVAFRLCEFPVQGAFGVIVSNLFRIDIELLLVVSESEFHRNV